LTLVLILSGLTCLHAADSGYRIKVHIEGMEDSTIYLAHHYGNMQVMKDTIRLDSKGNGVFSGEEKLPGGIYLVVLPPDNHYFEIIIDRDQAFSLTTREGSLVDDMIVKGSEDNKVFYEDLRFIKAQRETYNHIRKLRDKQDPGSDSAKVYNMQLEQISQAVNDHREELARKYPDMFYIKVLKATKDPTPPEPERDSAGNLIDSFYVYHYYKYHFFDNFDFSDERLLRTPIYHRKLDDYIHKWTIQYPDSIIKAVDRVVSLARANHEIFKYTVAYLLNEYASNKIMGMDAVYVHIAEKYYLSGEADWIGEEQLDKIRKDALALKPLLLGKTAPNVIVRDRAGNWRSLNDVQAKYTILYFWDSDCGTCRKETPKLYDYYLKVKKKGVEVFAVSIELLRENWESFIDEHHMTEWINCIDDKEETNFRYVYNIKGTPLIFLLDKDKKIVAKRLSVEQLEQYLDRLLEEKEKL